jgi:hypothetical protein
VSDFSAARSVHERRTGTRLRVFARRFGVGFSSFNYVKQLPVDYVKIDGSFVRTLVDSPDDQVFVRALAEVARGFGKKTVAEFVEDERALNMLRSLWCGLRARLLHRQARPGDCLNAGWPARARLRASGRPGVRCYNRLLTCHPSAYRPPSMALFTLGINHHTAPLSVREQLAFHAESVPQALADLTRCKPVHEAAILSTCNRTECTSLPTCSRRRDPVACRLPSPGAS